MKYVSGFLAFIIAVLCSCSPAHQLNKAAQKTVLQTAALKTAHVGISIYEPATNKYWYNYQGDKYFVPASNTKLATCYAAMKYLGDSLVGLRYHLTDGIKSGSWTIVPKSAPTISIQATGDPTFLHPDFNRQPVYDFLKNDSLKIELDLSNWQDERWGNGWSWNDYNDSYMAERSVLPMYGNVVRFSNNLNSLSVIPHFFSNDLVLDSLADWSLYPFAVQRKFDKNGFYITAGKQIKIIETPFTTNDNQIFFNLLADTLHKTIYHSWPLQKKELENTIHSQPTDSLLKPMMHRSDNFFAEQTLLMVSNELLGFMNDEKIIDTLLKTDYKDLPQKPVWVDGCGLSRYNLFSPQDFIFILNKMRTDFGAARIQNILATGNQGTLKNYYKSDSSFIYAKTGTLSGVVALSGYLYTRKNKLLIFSVLVNNHHAAATEVRRAVESFIEGIRNKY